MIDVTKYKQDSLRVLGVCNILLLSERWNISQGCIDEVCLADSEDIHILMNMNVDDMVSIIHKPHVESYEAYTSLKEYFQEYNSLMSTEAPLVYIAGPITADMPGVDIYENPAYIAAAVMYSMTNLADYKLLSDNYLSIFVSACTQHDLMTEHPPPSEYVKQIKALAYNLREFAQMSKKVRIAGGIPVNPAADALEIIGAGSILKDTKIEEQSELFIEELTTATGENIDV